MKKEYFSGQASPDVACPIFFGSVVFVFVFFYFILFPVEYTSSDKSRDIIFNEILLPLAAVNVEMPLSATCSYFSDGKCPKKYQLTIRSRF